MNRLEATKGHTPGPWHVGPEGGPAWVAIVGPHVVYADDVPEPGSDDADAALIALAPALLAVAEAAVGFADHVANEDHGEADGVCFGCGQAWPCFVERLAAALAPLTEEENRG